ncbi:MAG UNVERIFIED_CONTAM: hypothetical protein LVR18_00330 [Planctomycetaceae bacterium]
MNGSPDRGIERRGVATGCEYSNSLHVRSPLCCRAACLFHYEIHQPPGNADHLDHGFTFEMSADLNIRFGGGLQGGCVEPRRDDDLSRSLPLT